jgi:hypothetical protein
MKLSNISISAVITRAALPVLLLCAPSTPAYSVDWRFTAMRPTRYGTSLAFIDVSSVRGGHGRVSFWASTYFSRTSHRMNRVNALVTANCAALTYRFDRIVLFYNQRPLGRWASRPTARALPQTNVYDEINSACGTRDLGTHIGVPEAFAPSYFAARQRG